MNYCCMLWLMLGTCIIPLTSYQPPEALFVPRHNIEERIVQLIDQETKSIKAAYATITNRAIIAALIRARQRGVSVELIVDYTWVTGDQYAYRCIQELEHRGISILYYKGATKGYKESIMHHKFIVFHATINRQTAVITGSSNPTHAGTHHNRENIIIIYDQAIAAAFEQEFEELKKTIIHAWPTPTPKPHYRAQHIRPHSTNKIGRTIQRKQRAANRRKHALLH